MKKKTPALVLELGQEFYSHKDGHKYEIVREDKLVYYAARFEGRSSNIEPIYKSLPGDFKKQWCSSFDEYLQGQVAEAKRNLKARKEALEWNRARTAEKEATDDQL